MRDCEATCTMGGGASMHKKNRESRDHPSSGSDSSTCSSHRGGGSGEKEKPSRLGFRAKRKRNKERLQQAQSSGRSEQAGSTMGKLERGKNDNTRKLSLYFLWFSPDALDPSTINSKLE